MVPVMNDLMSVKDAASYARVHTESVLRWIRAGRLRAGKAGKEYRIEPSDLRDFMGLPKNRGGRPPKRKKVFATQRRRP